MIPSLSHRQVINGFITCLTFIVLQGIITLAIGGNLLAEDNHPMPGGYAKMAINAQNVTDVADFAIEEQKTLMKAAGKSDAITLVKIVEAERAVVAGFNYRLKIQVKTDQTTTVVSIIVYEGVTGEHKKKLTSWKDVAE